MMATLLPIIQSCDGCGACCMHMGYPPFPGMFDYDKQRGDPEWLALPRELALECRQGAVDGRGHNQLPCIWLDLETRKCRHYEQRPSICREFDMGNEDCRRMRVERGIT